MHIIIYISLITLLLSYNDSNAQWSLQNSGTTKWLFETYFLNADTGLVVGDYGLVLRTNNGGSTWNQQFTPNTFVYLLCTHFPTKQIGYIGGQDGYIAKTIDGGLNFVNATPPQNWDNINSIYFLNKDTGFVTSLAGIYKTTDGANSWQSVSGWPIGSTTDLFFINDTLGYSVGNYFQKTTDGGNNWIVTDTLTAYNPESIFFTSKDTGYIACSNPAILKTTDGGLTWNAQTIPSSSSADGLYSITFTSKNNGYAVGGKYGAKGIILQTADGGTTWTNQLNNTSLDQFTSVFFPNDSIGYTASMGGHILKTTNGGLTYVSTTLKSYYTHTISPNPFTISTTIQSDKFLSNAVLMVYNSLGQIVKQTGNLYGHTVIFNRDNLSIGMYFIRLIQDNTTLYTDKLIMTDN